MSDQDPKKLLPGSQDSDVQAWLGLSQLSAEQSPEDALDEERAPTSLRPESFAAYIGQESVKRNLSISCRAAAQRGEALDHILLHGPPGLGKTSLARIIAAEMGVSFKSTSGPVLERPGDLAAVLAALETRDVLFIDEIHRLPRVVEEVLYPALEDFQIDIIIGQGPAARAVKIELKPFTLIGATTRTSLLTSPLRDRFGIVTRLNFYEAEELAKIVSRSAALLGLKIDASAAAEIGRRARGTPRIANRLLKRVRDFAQDAGIAQIETAITKKALALLDIDELGFDSMDRRILETIIDKFGGGPVGIETIAAAIGEDRDTLEDVYEPFLIQQGMLARTRRGREVTDLGYQHIGRAVNRKQLDFAL